MVLGLVAEPRGVRPLAHTQRAFFVYTDRINADAPLAAGVSHRNAHAQLCPQC